MTPRRNLERRHVQRGKYDTWLTFYRKERPGPFTNRFGVLVAFDEMRLSPDEGTAPHLGDEAEIITYVYKGALAQEDSTGSSGVIHAGEFQRMTTGRRIRHKETNASRTDWAHVFRISLRPAQVSLDRAHEQKRFMAGKRHNVLCVVASPDTRKESLRIHQDALICSSILDPGNHLIHELLPGRSAWLHIVCGEVALNDTILTQGDGVGVTNEPAISITAQENSEILLVDLGQTPLP